MKLQILAVFKFILIYYSTIIACFDENTDGTISNGATSDSPFRLPKRIKPLHYDLYLHPNLDTKTFQGNVTILLDVMEECNYIELHQQGLNITSAKLNAQNCKDDIPHKSIVINDEFKKLTLSYHNTISIGMYYLSFEFNGALMPFYEKGFFSTKYKNGNDTRTIAATQFEATRARRAFPCFDEPSFKATFSIKLVHPTGDGYSALSNMNIESTEVDEPHKNLTTVTFAKSVPMSAYLVCFIVSDFVSVTGSAKKLDNSTFPISIYTTRAQKDETSFALDISIKLVEFFTNMFKIDYPLPKLDMIAIPDFKHGGGMENFGLITYQEVKLLYNMKESSTVEKDIVIETISHEIAHIWFGNLVTMQWWGDIWLNEGFAEYMQYIGVNSIMPNWDFMDRFLIETLHLAFICDSKNNSHAIIQTVNNLHEIDNSFDGISYKKGASVLRMLDNFLGKETFTTGVQTYLNKFAYKNVDASDFFRTLQNQANVSINITSIMDTWTRQAGYPVVNVIKNNSTHYTLRQKRFLSDPEEQYDPKESPYGYKWTIPVTYRTDKNSEPTLVWFYKDTEQLEIILNEPVEWIKFNCDQIGYYRVNYSAQEWESLAHVLRFNHTRLSVPDRASLIEDALSLAEASQLDYIVAMKMTLYLNKEHNSVPWSVAADKLVAMNYVLLSTNVGSKFRDYVTRLVNSSYHNVTWKVDNSEDHDRLRLRPIILNLACAVEHIECLHDKFVTFQTYDLYNYRNDIARADTNDTDEVPHPDGVRGFIFVMKSFFIEKLPIKWVQKNIDKLDKWLDTNKM